MSSPDDRTQELPHTVPAPNPRVVAYVLASVGAILLAVGAGVRWGAAWGLMVAGVLLLIGAVLLVDVPRSGEQRARAPRGPGRGQVSPPSRPAPPPRPVFPTAVPDPQQPAAGSTRGGG